MSERSDERRDDLAGRAVVVTAGPTREPIDPVRYLSNRSSGKMGYAIAAAAAARGAAVSLISGPVAVPTPEGVEVVAVETAREMHDAVTSRAPESDALIMAAAVADYRVAAPSDRKIKRTGDDLTLRLVPNPDILASVGRARREAGGAPAKPTALVGFALETDALFTNARGKLERKGCDLLVANLAGQSIGLDASVAHILDREGGVDSPGELDKHELADRILDHVAERLGADQRTR